MRTRTAYDLPAGLESTRRRFDRWRQTRDGLSRIPEALWAAAVKAAGTYGLHPTVRALGLDYNSLKRHVEAAPSRPGLDEEGVATFVELPPPVSMGPSECVLELEDPGGAKMRIHLKGMPAPDLTALSQSFWSLRPQRGARS
jgi:hypothetical protein